MEISIILLVLVVVTALVFEYINGFHDCANAIATVVSTRVLTPKQAVYFSAFLNFVGAFLSVSVAKTIGDGLVASEILNLQVIWCALIGAIAWNLITWYLGLPSSSSHALIGGLLGAGITNALYHHIAIGEVIRFSNLLNKVLIPMVCSPIFGFFIGFMMMILLLWLVCRSMPKVVNKRFRALQLLSSGFMALSHGTNDAQKTMGIISVALFSAAGIMDKVVGDLQIPWLQSIIKTYLMAGKVDGELQIPGGVIVICALTMALGTMAGGWKIIRTMGSKVAKLRPIHGFAAESSAAAVIMGASHLGIPVSTTHVISSAIMGVGATSRSSKVKWSVVKNIVFAWILTIPMAMLMAAAAFFIYHFMANLI